MDSLVRLLAYLIVGAVLLYCNILYLRALRSSFEPGDYVIMPIRLVGQGDKDGSRGIALAQMLQARLKSIEGNLGDAQDQLSTPQAPKSAVRTWLPSMIPLVNQGSERKGIPTSLFEPANVNVAVGGVQVGGVVAWIQNLLVRKRTLTFTFYVVDKDKTIVSGNAQPLSGSGGSGAIWFESGSQDKAIGSDGSRIAKAVMERVDRDVATLTEIFGGTMLPDPFIVVIKRLDPSGEGLGGAYHYRCSDQTLFVDAKTKPAADGEFSSFLFVSQAVDVFGAVQNKGWSCGSSNGAGLKRALAASLYPDKTKDWETAPSWLDTPNRPDWVNQNDPTDIDAVATGCAVLFLNYLHTQLNIPWQKIVQVGGSTLGQTYANLGLGSDGFTKFKQLLDKHFPVGTPSRLTTDNPFPL
jgi:hypothetical protein